MRYLIRNGSIIDPAQRVATVGDVLISDGLVEQLVDLTDLHAMPEPVGDDVEIINARGCVIAPGFTDLHVHLREPGDEHKETLASGTLAAAVGGFTTICAMPSTRPITDTAAVVSHVQGIAARDAHVNVEIIGALTKGREGTALAELIELAEAGCIAFSDGGRPIADTALMANALTYAAVLGLPVMTCCEDRRLTAGWAMHEGVVSTRLGLAGFPVAAEEALIARDIALAEAAGAHLHICQVSTAGGVALIRAAKARGVHVTAEVTPHHLTLTDRWVMGNLVPHDTTAITKPQRRGRRKAHPELGINSWLDPSLLPPYDPSTRVSPPLRSEEDIDALIEGLRDGTIDAIATGHAPHALVDKECEYALAAPGISGLETALALVLTLVHRGEMDLVNMIAKLTEGPAQVLGRSPSTLHPGTSADLVIFNPDELWTVDTGQFISKGHNNPLHGQRLKGQVMLTMVAGKIVYRREDFGQGITQSHPTASRLEGILPSDS
ncbi:dihydroorotase [Candidatus Viridilinea mediisalina]|uniref:Dihydroorotase n=1 Tax=Candidatus Viridilinea mediisalina TaxID=2024553 RepID=A0A2A6RHG0_9CHLR|nr:dihydroorotase [Candidatus Viridilinea mediisalina]PDW02452.1 dihydroorotase [Candidatus Viridilinea mediisalina]